MTERDDRIITLLNVLHSDMHGLIGSVVIEPEMALTIVGVIRARIEEATSVIFSDPETAADNRLRSIRAKILSLPNDASAGTIREMLFGTLLPPATSPAPNTATKP